MKDDSAFPQITSEQSTVYTSEMPNSGAQVLKGVELSGGLTKREYFAGQALFAHLWINRNYKEPPSADSVAQDAVACADALIAALEKETK